eukprot:473768_1
MAEDNTSFTTICYFVNCCAQQNDNLHINITQISILSFMDGSSKTKQITLEQFDDAFHKFGFVQLVDHNIPPSLSQNLFDNGYKFFSEPTQVKMQHYYGKIGSEGYQPLGAQNVNGYSDYNDSDNLNLFDSLESFNIYSNYKSMVEMQSGQVTMPSFTNIPQQFSNANIQLYWSLIRHLLQNVHSIASQSLGFEQNNNVFEKNMSSGHMHIRLANYIDTINVMNCSANDIFVRFGAHRDYSGFTIIHNQYIDGLQVQINDTWHSIPSLNNSFVLLGGEFISMWTNNYWKSVLHRVISKGNKIKQRKTIIMFSSPNIDTVIDILPCDKCIQYNANRMFEPVNGIQWVNSRVQKTHTSLNIHGKNKYPWEKKNLCL